MPGRPSGRRGHGAQQLLSERHREGAGAAGRHSTRPRGSCHPRLCPQGLELPETHGFPSPSHKFLTQCLHPPTHPRNYLLIESAVYWALGTQWGHFAKTPGEKSPLGKAGDRSRTGGGRTGGSDGGESPEGGWRRTQGGGKDKAGAPAALEGCLGGEALRAGATAPSPWQPRRSQTQLGKSGELSTQDTHTQFGHRQGPARAREKRAGTEGRGRVSVQTSRSRCKGPRARARLRCWRPQHEGGRDVFQEPP